MTDAASDIRLDERGLITLFVRVDFYSESNIWDYLRRLEVEVEQKGTRWATHLYGLPKEGDAPHYLHVWLHTEPGEDDADRESRVHWVLSLSLIPETEPPPKISISSEKLGGYPAILDRLAAVIPNEVRATINDLRATASYLLAGDHWEQVIAGQSLTEKVAHGVMKLNLVSQVWEVESDDAALTRVTIDRSGDVFVVTGAMRLEKDDIRLSSELMKKTEEKIWAELRTLLTPSRG